MKVYIIIFLAFCGYAVSEVTDPNWVTNPYSLTQDNYTMPDTWEDGYAGDSEEDGWMLSAFKKVWNWFYDHLLGYGERVINKLLGFIPEDWAPDVGGFFYYLEILNAWIAVDYAMSLMSVYYSSLLVFIVIKFILKLIPAVG